MSARVHRLLMRFFNTSGPNIPAEHYTLERPALIAQGLDLVRHSRYFTIWAPRQSGKSTYFRLMINDLEQEGFQVIHLNYENYIGAVLVGVLRELQRELSQIGLNPPVFQTLQDVSDFLKTTNECKLILIIDEIEGLNPDFFGQFLHTIRNLYHSRETHCLKSVMLVGVSNIVGVVNDNASPFNIADNLPVPYFTEPEVNELLNQHTRETGQVFEQRVIDKIFEITAGQPGLVNGFAYQLVTRHPDKPVLDYDDYLRVEDWYLTEAIDKNVANIINKARQYRAFVERLLFTEPKVPFQINRENIKVLHTNGILKKGADGFVEFWVPLYKKCLHAAFYPYMNGEEGRIQGNIDISDYFTPEGTLHMPKVIEKYKEYALKRGFRYFLEFDEQGNALSIKEAALMYSFETYINAFLGVVGGKSYIEPHTNLGRSDMIINIGGQEAVIESKVYQNITLFNKGKEQVAYYAQRLGLTTATYLVFLDSTISHKGVVENVDFLKDKNVVVTTYLVRYDLETDF